MPGSLEGLLLAGPSPPIVQVSLNKAYVRLPLMVPSLPRSTLKSSNLPRSLSPNLNQKTSDISPGVTLGVCTDISKPPKAESSPHRTSLLSTQGLWGGSSSWKPEGQSPSTPGVRLVREPGGGDGSRVHQVCAWDRIKADRAPGCCRCRLELGR